MIRHLILGVVLTAVVLPRASAAEHAISRLRLPTRAAAPLRAPQSDPPRREEGSDPLWQVGRGTSITLTIPEGGIAIERGQKQVCFVKGEPVKCADVLDSQSHCWLNLRDSDVNRVAAGSRKFVTDKAFTCHSASRTTCDAWMDSKAFRGFGCTSDFVKGRSLGPTPTIDDFRANFGTYVTMELRPEKIVEPSADGGAQ